MELDVHLRVNDEVQIYCGLTRVLNVRRNGNGTVSVSAHQTYSRQDCARAILRRWNTDEVDEFGRALDAYLDSVNVSKRHSATEGAVQSCGPQPGARSLPEWAGGRLHNRRLAGPRADRGQRRATTDQPSEEACPPQAAHHRRAWLRPTLEDRRGAPQSEIRERVYPGHHQPALRRVG